MASDRPDRHRHALLLAGGAGVRFWPRSRESRPKQLLNPLGGASLLRRTFERLLGTFPPERILVLTGREARSAVASELPEVPYERIVAEPCRRNTAPAIGLATALLLRDDPDAVMGVFPCDQHLDDEKTYRSLVEQALEGTGEDRLVLLGFAPNRAETGYGYLEFPSGTMPGEPGVLPVVAFREKPDLETAERFAADERFCWNSGQFFWKASVFAEEMERHLPETWGIVTGIAGQPRSALESALAEHYGGCESISVDRGVLEHSDRVSGIAAPEIGWTDLGSWESLYRALARDPDGNCTLGPGTFVRSDGNFVDAPGKHVALVGVSGLVVVETPDALLVCRRDESQDVGAVTEALREAGLDNLL